MHISFNTPLLRIALALGSSLLGQSALATPPSTHSLAALRVQAEHWLLAQLNDAENGAKISVRAGELDQRVRLPACTQALAFSFAPGQSSQQKTSVTVLCQDRPGWRLFLPMTISRQHWVWVANRTISAATPLQESHWQRQLRDVASLPCAAFVQENLAAYEARMTLASGAVLCDSAIKAKTAIERGRKVHLLTQLGSITVSMAGEAVDSGGIGHRIRVKNSQSGRVIEGVIVNESTVQIQ